MTRSVTNLKAKLAEATETEEKLKSQKPPTANEVLVPANTIYRQ